MWAKPAVLLFLVFVTASSCRDDLSLIGFPSPDANFQISFKEFAIPTHIVQLDSVITTNGGGSGETNRLLVGYAADNTFGNSTAEGYTQFFAKTFPGIPSNATVERLTLTLVFDYYHSGSPNQSTMNFEVYQLSDSIVNSVPYFSGSELRHAITPMGTASKVISPAIFDQSILDNSDNDPDNDVIDSLNIDLTGLGDALLAAARDTVGNNELAYTTFRKFRRNFPGLVIKSPGADKIVGFSTTHPKSRLTLHYVDGATKYQIEYSLSPGSGIVGFSRITTDRSATSLAGIQRYDATVASDNRIYLQCGTGLVARLDFSEVYDFFKDIPIKALSVAELSITGDVQTKPVNEFYMRAMRPDNRFRVAVKNVRDAAYDSVTIVDTDFKAKHLVDQTTSNPRLDPIGDDGRLFTLKKTDEPAATQYKGYLTNFMQRELLLGESETLKLFALVPYNPEFGKSLNGVHFPKDNVVLRIYYTTPAVQE